MSALIEIFISSFITFFVVIDPVGVAAIYLGMIGRQGVQDPARLASRASLIGFSLMFLFALVGKSFIEAIGITLPAFRVAGGLLLFYLSFRMVMGHHETDMNNASAASQKDLRDLAVFPLAIPLLAGPGGLTVSILMMDRAAGDDGAKIAVIAALASVGVLAWLSLLSAHRLQKLLGQNGIDILARVLGVILSAMSVQFVADGARALMLKG